MHEKLSGALKNVETFCFKARILFLKSPKRFKKSWRAFSGVPETLEESDLTAYKNPAAGEVRFLLVFCFPASPAACRRDAVPSVRSE